MIQLREANARSSVSLIAPAHPPCRAPGAPDASDANRSRSRSDRLFTHTPPKTRDLARKIFSPKKSHLYGKSLSWRSSRARRRASSRAHLSVRGVPVQANPALIVCASARARAPSSVSSNSPTHDASTRRDNQSNESRDFSPHLHRAAPSSRRSRSRSRSPARRPRRPSLRPRSSRRSRARDRSIVARVRPSRRRVPTRRTRRSRRKESLASRPGCRLNPNYTRHVSVFNAS